MVEIKPVVVAQRDATNVQAPIVDTSFMANTELQDGLSKGKVSDVETSDKKATEHKAPEVKLNFFEETGAKIKAFMTVTGKQIDGADLSQYESDRQYNVYKEQYMDEMKDAKRSEYKTDGEPSKKSPPKLSFFDKAGAKIKAFMTVTGKQIDGANLSQYESDRQYNAYKEQYMDQMLLDKAANTEIKPSEPKWVQ